MKKILVLIVFAIIFLTITFEISNNYKEQNFHLRDKKIISNINAMQTMHLRHIKSSKEGNKKITKWTTSFIEYDPKSGILQSSAINSENDDVYSEFMKLDLKFHK